MTAEAAVLLAALLVGHFLGDFTPLANARIQAAKANGGPMRFIAAHAGIHALLVAVVALVFAGPAAGLLALVVAIQFVTHFGLDAFRSRLGVSSPGLRDPKAGIFWTVLGLDQLAHGLVLVGIAALLV